jgi:striatin 1/3/4
MAYQQQGGLQNGPGGSGEHHGPQGTEYTLQGKRSTLELAGRDVEAPRVLY